MLSRKWTTWLLAGLIVAVAVGTPLGVYAGNMKKDAWGMADTPLGRLIMGNVGRMLVLKAELNLTEEQKDKICNVLKEHKHEIATKVEHVWQKRNALRDLVVSDEANEEQIREAATELGKAIGDTAVMANGLWTKEVSPILTEEQKSLLDKFRHQTDTAAKKFFDTVTKEKKAD